MKTSFEKLHSPAWACGEVLTHGFVRQQLSDASGKEPQVTLHVPNDILGLLCRFVGPFLVSV